MQRSRPPEARTMYPRVKVQERPDPNLLREETTSLILKAIKSLSLEDQVPAADHGNILEDDSSSTDSMISNAHISNFSASSICNGSAGRNKKSPDEDKKTNIRASSVPRPRAILSSPDNDDMIGLQNQLSRERERRLKGKTVRESVAGQSKPMLKNDRVQSPVSTRGTAKGTSNNSHSNTKSSLLHKKQVGQTPRKGKANPVWV